MQTIDQERAVLTRIQNILDRLRPLMEEITVRELKGRSPTSETQRLETSLQESMDQMQRNLNQMELAPNKILFKQKIICWPNFGNSA